MVTRGFGKLKHIIDGAGPEAEGQSLVEYALIILFVAIACIIALTAAAGEILHLWTDIRDTLVPIFTG